MVKNLFIDANIWLSVYQFTSDALVKFEKLKALLGSEIHLFVPEQVYHEVLRNRDAKIKSTWDEFKLFRFQTPTFCQSYAEYEAFQSKYKQLQGIHSKWVSEVERDVRNISLKADALLLDLFSTANVQSISADIVTMAELRYRSGNPPGKNNSLGDAINWEYLLARVPEGEDLYFISSDKDYCSCLDPNRFNLFLFREWNGKKHSNIIFFRNLSDFLMDHAKSFSPAVPENGLDTGRASAQEQHAKEITELAEAINKSLDNGEKQNAIMLLRNSHSYANTHNAISLLSKYTSWTTSQIDELCEAALTNSQVADIIYDDDVRQFYIMLLSSATEETKNIAELRREVFPSYRDDDGNEIFF